MRNKFAELLLEESKVNSNIFLLTGDLGYGVLDSYMNELPSQFMNCGIAEQSMIGIAGGISSKGKKVFVYSIANFPTFRCLEQIRNDLIYMNRNVTIVSVGAGFSYGSQGYSHHGIEDISIMRCLGNISIFSPSDPAEVEAVMPIIFNSKFTTYLRLGKGGEDTIHQNAISDVNYPILFSSKSGNINGKLVCILSLGAISREIIEGAEALGEVCNFKAYSVPVLIEDNIKEFLNNIKADLIITLEEHVLPGGFGGLILEIASKLGLKIPVKNMGVDQKNIFKNGSQKYLRGFHGIDSHGIIKYIKQNL